MIDHSLENTHLSRRARRKIEVRRRIYEAAIALFRDRGYESTTVQDICDVADTAKQTFFNYFPSKDHILAEYHTKLIEGILQEISRFTALNPLQAIVSAIRVFAPGAEKSASLSRTILRHVFSSDVLELNDRQNEQKIFQWFYTRIRKAIQIGKLSSESNLHLLTTLIMCVLSSTVQEWICSSGGFDLEEELVRRTRFVLRLAMRSSSQKEKKR